MPCFIASGSAQLERALGMDGISIAKFVSQSAAAGETDMLHVAEAVAREAAAFHAAATSLHPDTFHASPLA